MTIDPVRVAQALETPQHPPDQIGPVVDRLLCTSNAEEYQDFQAVESFRRALAELAEPERRRRATAFSSCWDGDSNGEGRARFARIGFAQGIDYHQLRDGERPELLGPSFAPISWYDVDCMMGAIALVGGAGDHLAACVDFAAFGTSDPRVFAWYREAFAQKDPTQVLRMSFTSPRDVNDRLLELILSPIGPEPSVEQFASHVLALQSTGAQDVETLEVCSRWLEARGHKPIAAAIDLRVPDNWDGGHRSRANAVHGFLARVWAANPVVAESVAESLFKRMWAPDVVAAVCAGLPFQDKVEVDTQDGYQRLYRQGRLVVTHAGKKGKAGRTGVTLHPDATKAAKAAKKKVESIRAGS